MKKAEEAVQKAFRTLFKRYPALHGFAVRKRGQKFCLSDIALHPAPHADLSALLEGEIATAIADLLEDRPEAAQILPGRTFARTLQ